MSDDAPHNPIDNTVGDCDRMLDAADNFQSGRRKSTSALRTMFGVFQPAEDSAVKVALAQTEQSLQQSQPKSAPLGPRI